LVTSAFAQGRHGFEPPDPIHPGDHGFELPEEIHPGHSEPLPDRIRVPFAHAPIHHQDTDDGALADYLAAFDYDGDFYADNNWDNLARGDFTGVVYYSYAETCTHFYVTYVMFHPRDWKDWWFSSEHENDMEGVLAIVSKDDDLGRLEALVTQAHGEFYSFRVPGSPLRESRGESLDGEVELAEWLGRLHPRTSQEAEGHGLKAWPHAGDMLSDQIVYWPSGIAEVPESADDRFVPYRLEPLDELWGIQLYEEVHGPLGTFAKWGTFEGDESGGCDDCDIDAAQTPWTWDDDDDAVGRGAFGLDPALLASVYFDGLDDDLRYVENSYARSLRDFGWSDALPPLSWDSPISLDDLYGRLDAVCR
jgi:hypothetical protein